MIITALISGLTAGIIVYTSYNKNTGINYNNINNDAALKQFLEVYKSISDDYYEDVNKTEMVEAAIEAMLNYLDDKYTSYLNTEQTSALNDSLKGEYEGIGVVILDHTITEVLPDSPAEKSGLKPGDVITKINDSDITSINSTELVKKMKSSVGSNILVSVLRDNKAVDFNVSIEKLYVPAIRSRVIEGTTIGYIRLATFSSSAYEQVEKALDKLTDDGITGLIIDLRANAGGYLDAAEKISNLFLEKNKVIYSLETKKDTKVSKDTTMRKFNLPVVVIVDGNTASAAEILSAALSESYGAKLVGTKTYGKGKVQQVISLVDGSMAKYTSGKWYTPSGNNIDKVGLTPDFVVELEIKRDNNGNIIEIVDSQYNKAVELLSN